MGFIMFITKE